MGYNKRLYDNRDNWKGEWTKKEVINSEENPM